MIYLFFFTLSEFLNVYTDERRIGGFSKAPEQHKRDLFLWHPLWTVLMFSFFPFLFFTPSTFFCIVWAFQLYSKKILSFQEVKNPSIMEGTSSRWVENYEIKIQLLWGIITEFLSGNLHISCYLFSFKNQFSFYD